MSFTEATGQAQYEMDSQTRDLAGTDQRSCRRFLHDQVPVCSRILVSRDTEDNAYASVYRKAAALHSRKCLTYMLLSCLISNGIGFMQKSSLCHVAQSCKAPGKNEAVSQYLGFIAHFWSKEGNSEAGQQTQLCKLERWGSPAARERILRDPCSCALRPCPGEKPRT